MTAPVQPPPTERPAPFPPAARPDMRPGFLRSLAGIWLLTWRTEMHWKRMLIRIPGLFVLPVLIFMALSEAKVVFSRTSQRPEPAIVLNEFAVRLQAMNMPLDNERLARLSAIFHEEFERSAARWRNSSRLISAEEQNAEMKDCYDRIRRRARTVLDEPQFVQLQSFINETSRSRMARQPLWNWTLPFYQVLLNLYFFLVLPLMCVRAAGGLIRDELQADTLGFLVTRPITRARLLLAKYLAHAGWMQILLAIQTGLIFAAAAWCGVPGLAKLLPLFLAVQFLAVLAWNALGVFLGQLTRRYIALALLYGFVIEMGIGRIPTNINNLSLMRHLKTLLAHDAPLQVMFEWSPQGTPFSVCAVLLAAVLFVGLAAALFTWFEYHHRAEMQV
ncbi:MAG TPA: ABC transporter permease subunit [Verrucomicrobiota bacterium]|nr:ABC transporter permease subunit [Verrucomicrobiota bacterium]